MRHLFAAGLLSMCFFVAGGDTALNAAPADTTQATDGDDEKQRQVAERFLGARLNLVCSVRHPRDQMLENLQLIRVEFVIAEVQRKNL